MYIWRSSKKCRETLEYANFAKYYFQTGKNCTIKTYSPTDVTQMCLFPFKYKGVTYNSCTSTESEAPWCAIKVTPDREFIDGGGGETWGFCENASAGGC